MGTRADFYIGIGKDAEWLGSIAWDGYPEGIDDAVLGATNEADYRAALEAFKAGRDDWTAPEDGWPWPWNDSDTTDCAYALHNDQVLRSWFGGDWLTAEQDDEHSRAYSDWEENGDGDEPERSGIPTDHPDMSDRKNVQFGGKRSGLIVIGG
jgi:hypothetical protein